VVEKRSDLIDTQKPLVTSEPKKLGIKAATPRAHLIAVAYGADDADEADRHWKNTQLTAQVSKHSRTILQDAVRMVASIMQRFLLILNTMRISVTATDISMTTFVFLCSSSTVRY
jgi:hypothetical protein